MQYDWYPNKKGKIGHRQACLEERNTGLDSHLPAKQKELRKSFPHRPHKEPTLLTLGLWSSILQNRERIGVCCLSCAV